MLDGSSSPGRPRLTDFGIAKYVQQEGTTRRSTMLVGTPQYIAPELIDGKEPTAATDLYALGIMLYELVCGVTPFAGGSTMAVLRNHAERLPGRPPGVPDLLWDLVSWLLGEHAASRPQSATQVATLLDALVPELAGLPAAVALREPSEPESSVHTQLTEMAIRPVTAPPAAAAVSPPEVDPAAATPRKDFARRRRVALIGALTAVLLLAGGGLAAAKLIKGPGPTESGPKTSATGQRPASTSAPSASASQWPASTSGPSISASQRPASVRARPQTATGLTNTSPWVNAIDAPGSAQGAVPAPITDAPGNGCIQSIGSVAGYSKVTCHTGHASTGLQGEGVLGVGSQWILVSKTLDKPTRFSNEGNPIPGGSGRSATTASGTGSGDRLERGCQHNPVNGIPICNHV